MKKEIKKYFSGLGKKSWEKTEEKLTPEQLKEKMSKLGKAGAEKRWKK